jgi:hypothetical protein
MSPQRRGKLRVFASYGRFLYIRPQYMEPSQLMLMPEAHLEENRSLTIGSLDIWPSDDSISESHVVG